MLICYFGCELAARVLGAPRTGSSCGAGRPSKITAKIVLTRLYELRALTRARLADTNQSLAVGLCEAVLTCPDSSCELLLAMACLMAAQKSRTHAVS